MFLNFSLIHSHPREPAAQDKALHQCDLILLLRSADFWVGFPRRIQLLGSICMVAAIIHCWTILGKTKAFVCAKDKYQRVRMRMRLSKIHIDYDAYLFGA